VGSESYKRKAGGETASQEMGSERRIDMKTFTEKEIVDLYLKLKEPPHHEAEPGILQFLEELGVPFFSGTPKLEGFVSFKSTIEAITLGYEEEVKDWPKLVQRMAQYILNELEKGELT
jgi:hypothetical protein